jgi:hypothetical protein
MTFYEKKLLRKKRIKKTFASLKPVERKKVKKEQIIEIGGEEKGKKEEQKQTSGVPVQLWFGVEVSI